jgi:hypothetical protein
LSGGEQRGELFAKSTTTMAESAENGQDAANARGAREPCAKKWGHSTRLRLASFRIHSMTWFQLAVFRSTNLSFLE